MQSLKKLWRATATALSLATSACVIAPSPTVNYGEAAFLKPNGNTLYTPGMSCPVNNHKACNGLVIEFDAAGRKINSSNGIQKYPGGGPFIYKLCEPVASAYQGLSYGRYTGEVACVSRESAISAEGRPIAIPEFANPYRLEQR